MHAVRRGILVLALIAVATTLHAEAATVRVGVLRSAASLRVSGWLGAWETDGSIQSLRALGLDVKVIYDKDLEGKLDDIDLLVVPGARCIPRKGAANVADWIAHRNGRLFATGMASYRDEKNQKVGEANDFQWAALFDADFQRWLGAWPFCEFLVLDEALAGEVGTLMHTAAVHKIELGRNTAMLVRARPKGKVLASWLDADGKTPTTDSGSASVAIVQGERVIYCGENLLAPELARSPEVIALVLALLRRLDADLPSAIPETLLSAPAPLAFPKGPTVAVKAGGPLLRVGIHDHLTIAGMAASSGLLAHFTRDGEETFKVGVGALLTMRVYPPSAAGQTGVVVMSANRATQRVPATHPIVVEPREAGDPIQFLQLRPNGTCKMQAFRGTLELTPHDDFMSMVNILSAEEYAAGVVPNETPAVYPQPALETMAVIARTFGLSRRGYHKSRGYDVCNTVDCQMYGGFLTEWDNANQAVNHTRDQVILYNDKLADSTFHAVCGGVGENVERVWPQPATPYLIGQPDGPAPLPDLRSDEAFAAFLEHPPDSYCSASPRFRWRETYTLPQLQTLFEKSLPVTLGAAYRPLGTLKAVRVTERSPLGRVLKLQIEGTDGTCVVEKDRIRWLWSGGKVGQGGLQSTLFRIISRPDGALDFVGGGWGHGVGMCQEGAAGMATRGRDYKAIIEHYYPHTVTAPMPPILK